MYVGMLSAYIEESFFNGAYINKNMSFFEISNPVLSKNDST